MMSSRCGGSLFLSRQLLLSVVLRADCGEPLTQVEERDSQGRGRTLLLSQHCLLFQLPAVDENMAPPLPLPTPILPPSLYTLVLLPRPLTSLEETQHLASKSNLTYCSPANADIVRHCHGE